MLWRAVQIPVTHYSALDVNIALKWKEDSRNDESRLG